MKAERIPVRLYSVDYEYHESGERAINIQMKIGLPDSFKANFRTVEQLEAFFEHCINMGFTTYEPQASENFAKGGVIKKSGEPIAIARNSDVG